MNRNVYPLKLPRRDFIITLDFQNVSFLREVYSGTEYIEFCSENKSSRSEAYLIRSIPKNIIDSFLELVIHVNKFIHVGNVFVPTVVEEKDDSYTIKFRYSKEKPLTNFINELAYEDFDKLVELLIQYLYGVENGIYPPIPYVSLEDIFVYAGEFFFLPPLFYSNISLRKAIEKHGDKFLFVAPEFLDYGICDHRSPYYTIGKLIESFDKHGRYQDLVRNLTFLDPRERILPPNWFEKFVPIKEGLIKNIKHKITQEISKSKKHFLTVQISTESYKIFMSIVSNLHKMVDQKEGSIFICIQDDFTNLPRQLISKYRNMLDDNEFSILYPALYANTKFGSILPTIMSVLNKVNTAFLVVDDITNSDYLIRTFLSHLQTFRTTAKIVVITKNSYQADLNFTYFDETSTDTGETAKVNFGLKFDQLDPEAKLLAVLGKRFRRNELSYLEEITKLDYEKYLEFFLKYKIVQKQGNEYVFDENLWEKIYNEISPIERNNMHIKLAKQFDGLPDPYNTPLFKNAYHYKMAGKDVSAAVAYLKFVRKNLETYIFSTERMKEALLNTYEILKKLNRLNSYAFNSILLKFRYQSWEDTDFVTLNIDDKKYNNFLILFSYYLDEKYNELIEKFHCFFDKPDSSKPKFTDFKQLYAYLLYQHSYYNLNDKLEDEQLIKNLSDNIPEFNKNWSILKGEYILLHVVSITYRSRKDAFRYIEKAREIAEKNNAKYLLIRIENETGIINDATAISIENFKRAIQLAGQIGYPKRTFIPYVNLLRALLYFGFFEELKEEINKSQNYISLWKNISDLAFYYRIIAFLPMYEQKYENANNLLRKALEFEKLNNLQQASLRGIILNELLCGNIERAKQITTENIDNPAIKTRAFEYLIKLLLAENDEEFKNVWIEYKNSTYHLLREEILYIFAERISVLDEEGFTNEIRKWESFYTSGGVNLSLFYVLLAKYKYFVSKGNKIKSEVVKSEICNLIKIMNNFEHPFVEKCSDGDFDSIKFLLHIFKRLDFTVSLEDFIKLFASEIYRFFKAQKLSIHIYDAVSGIDYKISNTNKLPEKDLFTVRPLELFIKDRIDDFSSYHIYIYSEEFNVYDRSDFENTITLIEELFTGQLKGIILRERSNIDNLTGLYNRWKFNQIIDEGLSSRTMVFSVFVMDIDDFKKINDTYGHVTGDKVLKKISAVLKSFCVDNNGIIARYGGEEFVGIFYLEKKSTAELCNKIREDIIKVSNNEFGFKVTVSIGVADSSERNTRTELLGLADQRLYIAKSNGKNKVVLD